MNSVTGEKRRAILKIGFDLLRGIAFSRPGEIVQVVENDVPEDAQVVNCSYDWQTDQLVLVLESPSFVLSNSGDFLTELKGPWFNIDKVAKESDEFVCTEPEPVKFREFF